MQHTNVKYPQHDILYIAVWLHDISHNHAMYWISRETKLSYPLRDAVNIAPWLLSPHDIMSVALWLDDINHYRAMYCILREAKLSYPPRDAMNITPWLLPPHDILFVTLYMKHSPLWTFHCAVDMVNLCHIYINNPFLAYTIGLLPFVVDTKHIAIFSLLAYVLEMALKDYYKL